LIQDDGAYSLKKALSKAFSGISEQKQPLRVVSAAVVLRFAAFFNLNDFVIVGLICVIVGFTPNRRFYL